MKPLVISPTYNEKRNIKELIARISQLNCVLDILIIDDNSPDGTGEIVKNLMETNDRIYLIEREGKLGLGTAYCRGFQWALERDYDPIIQMDADLSHNPDDIPRLIDASEFCDSVIGSRYIEGVNVVNWPMRRLLLSYFANWYARVVIRLPIMDLTGGFKCIRRRVLKEIDFSKIRSEGYSFQIEMNFRSWRKGFNIIEHPIIFIDRTIGESKMSKSIMYEAVFVVWRLRIWKLFGWNK